MSRWWRRWCVPAGVAAAVALLAGCGTIGSLIDTTQALRDAGYQSVKVNSTVSNGNQLDVRVSVSAVPSDQQATDVARIVWHHFHERFDFLHVTVRGSGPPVVRDLSHDELVALFGPRNPAWDRTSISSSLTRLGEFVIGGLVAVAVAVVVIVLLVTRSRRRRAPPSGWAGGGWAPSGPTGPAGMWVPGGPTPPGPPPGGGYPLWPPPPGPPPGRGPAAPPSWPPAAPRPPAAGDDSG